MPAEMVKYMLSDGNIHKRLCFRLVLQCAPLLKGIKAACMMNVERKFLEEWNCILEDTGITYKILIECGGKCLILLYRKNELDMHLKQREIRMFLKQYGYGNLDLKTVLEKLSERVKNCSGETICFPHEIGVFLDYPVADVQGFIKNKGRNYLKAGYWKVYDSLEKAERMFQEYDQAKEYAVQEFLKGKHLRDITVRTA